MSPENLPNLFEYLDAFQKSMAEIHGSLSNPQEKAVLGELLGQLQQSRKEVEQIVPDLVKELHAKNLDLKAWSDDFLPQVEKLQGELEGKLKAAAEAQRAMEEMAVAPQPEEVVPSNLGATRGSELLERLGLHKPAAAGAIDLEGSVASAWVDPASADAHHAKHHEEAKEAPKPEKKTVKKSGKKADDDIWEGLSHLGD